MGRVIMNEKKLAQMYRTMWEIRHFEKKVLELYMDGYVPGLVHVYIGEEAIATGVCAALNNEDYIVSTHRAHGHSIAKGAPPSLVAAEILGKATGVCRGRGGSMRLSYPKVGLLYSSSIVGADIPIAVGAALSSRLRQTNQVVGCFFGDGATNTGDFHEGLNLASIWNLPVVFVCENNLYAVSTRITSTSSSEDLAVKATTYGIPGITVDGNDVIAVYKAADRAVKRARSGEGPTLIEAKTYRWTGHAPADPGTAYRSKDEIEMWKRQDPIKRFSESLRDRLSDEEIQRIELEAEKKIDEAVKFALESPFPSPAEVTEYIF
jgi:TPP-dependent pyruvate/acetoin dehydrogenase alpha subunit